MSTKKQVKGKKETAKGTKKAAQVAVTPEEVAIALALAQALGTPHDEESYQLTIRHKEIDPWSLKIQNMRVTPQKQYYI